MPKRLDDSNPNGKIVAEVCVQRRLRQTPETTRVPVEEQSQPARLPLQKILQERRDIKDAYCRVLWETT